MKLTKFCSKKYKIYLIIYFCDELDVPMIRFVWHLQFRYTAVSGIPSYTKLVAFAKAADEKNTISVSDIDTEENTQILDTNVQGKCVDFKEGYSHYVMSFIYVFY